MERRFDLSNRCCTYFPLASHALLTVGRVGLFLSCTGIDEMM